MNGNGQRVNKLSLFTICLIPIAVFIRYFLFTNVTDVLCNNKLPCSYSFQLPLGPLIASIISLVIYVLSYFAINQIKKSGESGKVLAVFSIIYATLQLLLFIISVQLFYGKNW